MSVRRQRPPPAASTPLLHRNARVPQGQSRFNRGTLIRLLIFLSFIGILFALFLRIPTSPDLVKFPEHVEGQYVRRMVAVGDLHGDYDNALKVFQMADVVDANGSWTGNVDYFVQTGDIIDR